MSAYRIAVGRTLSACACTLLLLAAFLCCCYRLPVGVKYGVNLAVIAIAGLSLLHRMRRPVLARCLRFFRLFVAAYAVAWLWSLALWLVQDESGGYVLRGTLNTVYMVTNIGCACALYYLLGAGALRCVIVAMVAANGLVLLEIGSRYGFFTLLGEYIRLVGSFSRDTGPVMRKLELHDMVPGWGVLLLFLLLYPGRTRRGRLRLGYIVSVLLSALFFTLGLKRICVAALAVAFGAGKLYLRRSERGRLRMVRRFSRLVLAGALVYVALIETGLLFRLAHALHVRLNGREQIFSAYRAFYALSPLHLGRGVRFIYHYGVTYGGVETLHSELLGMYIELGFYVWPVWLYVISGWRVRRAGRAYTYRSAAFLFAFSVYLMITFATDNTLYHYPANVLGCLLSIIASRPPEGGKPSCAS